MLKCSLPLILIKSLFTDVSFGFGAGQPILIASLFNGRLGTVPCFDSDVVTGGDDDDDDDDNVDICGVSALPAPPAAPIDVDADGPGLMAVEFRSLKSFAVSAKLQQ